MGMDRVVGFPYAQDCENIKCANKKNIKKIVKVGLSGSHSHIVVKRQIIEVGGSIKDIQV
jgi:hypothetical protein